MTLTFRRGRRPSSTACSCEAIPPRSFAGTSKFHPPCCWGGIAKRSVKPALRGLFTRMVEYRRHVLAIFEALVDTESRPPTRAVRKNPLYSLADHPPPSYCPPC